MTSDLHRTAVHEAGHAVCAFLLGVEAGAVTIEPNGDNAGLCEVIPCYHPRRKYKHAATMAMVYLAGAVAELLAFNDGVDDEIIAGGCDDFRKMKACCRAMGLSEIQTIRCQKQAARKVTRMLKYPPHAKAVESLAITLLVKTTLSWSESLEVMVNAMETAIKASED